MDWGQGDEKVFDSIEVWFLHKIVVSLGGFKKGKSLVQKEKRR